MTADDSARDDARRDSDGDAVDPDAQPQTPLDEEAAWRLIVENYGERPAIEDAIEPPAPPTAPQPPDHGLFDRSYLDSLDAGRSDPAPRHDRRKDDSTDQPVDQPVAQSADQPAGRDDEEHFVPPDPPPVPKATPARRLAWCGLFLPPLLMLAAVVFDWIFPSWLALGLVAAFVGGFVFLVASMPRNGGDGWGDGAVV